MQKSYFQAIIMLLFLSVNAVKSQNTLQYPLMPVQVNASPIFGRDIVLHDMPGRIYTAQTDPDFNSPFTAPVNLDGINPANANLCRNPVIACQYNNADDDENNIIKKYDYHYASQD